MAEDVPPLQRRRARRQDKATFDDFDDGPEAGTASSRRRVPKFPTWLGQCRVDRGSSRWPGRSCAAKGLLVRHMVQPGLKAFGMGQDIRT